MSKWIVVSDSQSTYRVEARSKAEAIAIAHDYMPDWDKFFHHSAFEELDA